MNPTVTAPEPHMRYLYESLTKKLFPSLDSLLSEEILSLQQLSLLAGDTFHIATKDALSLAKNYITNLPRNPDGSKQKLAMMPAGKMFKDLIQQKEIFTNVTLVGGFDGSLTKTSTCQGVTLYPTNSVNTVSTDQILILTDGYAKEIFDQLSTLINTDNTSLYCPFWDLTSSSEIAAKEITEINTLCKEDSHEPVILVTCIRFFSFIYKRLKALRQANCKVILVTLLSDVSNAVDISEMADACDYIYSAQGNMLNYLYVLSMIKPDIVHIFANAGSSAIPLLASRVCSAPYAVEYNDILTNMHNRKSLAKAIGADNSEQEFKTEKFLLMQAKGLIYNNHESAITHLFKFHNLTIPSLQFLYYPLNPVQKRSNNQATEKNKIKLVFIGGIRKSEYDHLCNYSYNDLLLMIDELTKQNFTVDIFNAYDSGAGNDFTEFYQKEKNNPNFKYHQAVHPQDLTKILNRYDAGLLVLNYERSKMKKEVLERTMSSRVYEYLEAGLPVIISRELKFMVSIIDEYDIGLPLSWHEMSNLSARLTPEKLAQLQENTKHYVNQILMPHQIPRLITFYSSIITNNKYGDQENLARP